MNSKKIKKVVVIGGGTGTYQVLTGLKKYPLNISAVISMCDSGGSTGKLRKELGILPPGDVRRAILALSDLPFAEKTLEEMFDFRFAGSGSLRGHSLGNILLAALVQITGSMDKAIDEAARILNASGKIYPVTLDNTNLVAKLTDGTEVYGESKIDMREVKLNYPIDNVFLSPKATIFKGAKKAISEADVIVLGPGDLYTSIVPTLLVEGMAEVLNKSKARLIYVTNLMTKRGETDNFKASDFVRVINKYLNNPGRLDYVFVNKKVNGHAQKIFDWYKKSGSIPVENDLKNTKETKVVVGDFVAETTFFRHNPDKLARVITKLL